MCSYVTPRFTGREAEKTCGAAWDGLLEINSLPFPCMYLV